MNSDYFKITRGQRVLLSRVIIFFVLALLTAFALFPFVWMLSTSFKPEAEIFASPPTWIPSKIVFYHYIKLYKGGTFFKYLLNSVIVVSITTILTIILAFPAAYGFSRFRFKRKKGFLIVTLLGQIMPGSVRFFPLYMTMLAFGVLNTFVSLWIGYIGWLIPFSILMLYGYLGSIPIELEEAALIDGASRLKVLTHIVIPLSSPGIAAVAIYCFMSAWEEFMLANVFIEDVSKRTLPVGLVSFIGQYKIDWGQMMAGSVIAILPVTIGFIIFQKRLISGLTQGAMKA